MIHGVMYAISLRRGGFRPQDPPCVPPQACYIVRGMVVVDMALYVVECECGRLTLFDDRAP